MAKQTDWERWVLDHAPGLLLFARQQSRCEEDAQDLVQEAVVEAAREMAALAETPECWFDSGIEDRDRSRLIQEAMSKLHQDYREVVTLKTWAGLTFAEIATALDIPANTAASRYRYGLEELRKALASKAVIESLRT